MKQFDGNDGKKLAAASVLVGLLAAGFSKRQNIAGSIHSAPGGPSKLTRGDWKGVFKGTKDALSNKNLPTLAAGVSYYSTLAFFPMLAAVVAIAALLITPQQLETLLVVTANYLPKEISELIASLLENLMSSRIDNFLAAGLAIAVALYGASGASKSLIVANNIVYGVKESRGWLMQQIWGVIWTVIGIVFGLLLVALLAINGGLLEYFGLPHALISWLIYSRWLMILLLTVVGLAVFYRYGSNRPYVRWPWVGWGAGLATVVWLVTTWIFFVYVQNFASFTEVYSLFAGIIGLMIWMYLSALIILLGTEINHQLETAARKKWIAFPLD